MRKHPRKERKMEFSKILKQLREKSGYTQEQLGSVLNLSKNAISHYENETNTPNLDTLIKIADTFDISVDYLVGRTKNSIPYSVLSKNYTPETCVEDILHMLMSLDRSHRSTIINILTYAHFHNDILNRSTKKHK